MTRAFSGRWARGLVNRFMLDHGDAPAGYPEINNATRPLRAAAAGKGDTERMSLWAGQGYRSALDRPAGEIIAWLCGEEDGTDPAGDRRAPASIATGSSASHLSGVDHLANTFSVMRHGQSKANVAGIIVSRIESDRRGDYGLSELGRARRSRPRRPAACRGTPSSSRPTSRARGRRRRSSARTSTRRRSTWRGAPRAVLRGLGRVGDRQLRPGLGSRRVGLRQVGSGVEPVAAVVDRTTALIVDLERRYSGRHILLVSHGDTLQILQAAFLAAESRQRHRRLPALQDGRDSPSCASRSRAASPR